MIIQFFTDLILQFVKFLAENIFSSVVEGSTTLFTRLTDLLSSILLITSQAR